MPLSWPERQWKDLTDDFAWQLYEVSAARQPASLKLERSLFETTSPELQVKKEQSTYYREFEHILIDLIDSRVLFTCRPM